MPRHRVRLHYCSRRKIRDRITTARRHFLDRPRHGRHGADARRRQNLRRYLSPGGERKISRAIGLRHLQQGLSRARYGGGAAAATGLVAAMDRPAGGRRYQVPGVARLRSRHRLATRRRQIGNRRLARMGLLRSHRMDRGPGLVRRQCRHGRHFRLRRRAARGRQETAAASQSDLPVRFARRLWRVWRLPRRISRRRHSPVPLPRRPFLGDASAQGAARRVAGGARGAVARRHEQSRL